MFKNFLKIAIRNLYRNRVFSIISILGLSAGLCATFLLVIYIKFELSFDKNYKDYDKIYRVVSISRNNAGKEIKSPFTLYQLSNELESNIPEVKKSTRTWLASKQEIRVGNESKGYYHTFFADSCFFDVFSLKSVYGKSLSKALTEPYTIVLTKSLSEKLFGDENPIGRVVKVFGADMVVKDVVYDVPNNSHFKFDFLISMYTNLEKLYLAQGNSFSTYVLFHEKASEDVINKTVQFISDYVNSKYKRLGKTYTYILQPVEDIYLNSDYSDNTVKMGNKQYIRIFGVLCILVLFIAIQNFINLYTSKSESRLKEVGIRKVIGASQKSIIGHFVGESIIVSIISFMLAMLLVETFIYDFGNLMNSHVYFDYSENIPMLLFFIAIVLLVGFLSGIFPALHVIKFNLINILKGYIRSYRNSFKSKVSLVIIQFTVSLVVITLLFGFFSQLRFMKNKELGFDQDQVVALQALSRIIRIDYEAIKNELLRNPNIISVTSSQYIPGKELAKTNLQLPEWNVEDAISVNTNSVRADYIKTYGFKLIEGNLNSVDLRSDSTSFIVNEKIVKLLNLENPINERIVVGKKEGYIKAIIKDYHTNSMHHAIEPVIISNHAKWIDYVSIRVQKGKVNETIDYIKIVLKKFDPDYTPSFIFLNDFFKSMYLKEERITKLIFGTSVLIIILSLLGLMALTSFSVVRRTKEIGIRKVVGADIWMILILINKDILKWGIISVLAAIPTSYVLLKKWLQNFAYNTNIQFWFFIAALAIVFGLAIFIITLQSFKIANKNPVDSLRYE